ncbi:dihydrolipoamide acetyltransferase family protein [Paenarthrobacter nicotinovorans]|uniref:dihydrolipoamide acetyltransferase family protein n=1 Tax=Paenarthrobacter TaxID=1742992 RepID=UPI001667F7BA|nr:dihydrolipoamide acetyltransferase family protein [Paenarthrobacter nicotinovorans]BCW12532.1 dihydrolipoamide acetyltransferase component of pyruvate dehydrogenase complex [Arthrobacter sp. NtRootA2]BCW16614.1 dihydrolipoamide acetyltransferase component of pyruvate dehydrogenase complex [Arthrobacter sp. NtRootA4]BCW24947.1 dihydrolipoamide acetyltransferase component of pyruvate dehydrogenase complex [Arthrobacter sp. NtRootC7]BCW29216.1 dihydrolipoamide acetyltransferase component of pyr
MTVKKFNLPDVGEGLTEAEVVAWKVKPGDTVAINDVLCEIETAKSLVELPSPFAGTVTELLVEEGITVEVGTAIIAVSEGQDGDAQAAPDAPAPAAVAEETFTPLYGKLTAEAGEQPAGGPLVGSGPKADAVKRRARKRPAGAVVEAAGVAENAEGTVQDNQAVLAAKAAEAPVSQRPTPARAVVEPLQQAPAAPSAQPSAQQPAATRGAAFGGTISGLVNKVLAKPPVRKFARDLGIDLADVVATGQRGEVTREDLVSYQAQRDAELDQADTFWGASRKPQEQRVERVPVKGVRKATAKAMVESAFSAPHVSIFVDVDASRTMEFVKRLKVSRDFEGIKVSPLLILAKAVIWAAARNPSVNATWVEDADGKGGAEIQIKHFMNLGIAAATPRGLMVPNIKDAQDLSLKELALALNELATKARAGKTQPAEMQGGTLTITNIGALGIDTGTPIINPGEVAIIAFGTIKQKPWVLDGEVIPRWITTLGGSFDHRVVDGDLSARFMADVAAILEEPALLLD